jgi:hypothetical protein
MEVDHGDSGTAGDRLCVQQNLRMSHPSIASVKSPRPSLAQSIERVSILLPTARLSCGAV